MLQILTMRHIQAKFRHETEGLLPSSATQVKSHHSNVLSYTHVHKNRLDAVAEVNVAKAATFTGKIETSARFLAMRFACKAAGVLATSGKSNSLYIRKEDTK